MRCGSYKVNVSRSLVAGINIQLLSNFLIFEHPELVVEKPISVLGVKLTEVFQITDSLVAQMHRSICNDMKIVVATLIHHKLFC